VGTLGGIANWYWTLPLRDYPILRQEGIGPYFYDWLDHPTQDVYWQQWAINERYDAIQTPALHIGGWYDVFLEGTLRNFTALRRAGGPPHKLLIGPWFHMPWSHMVGAVDFGPAARNCIDDLQVRWFNHWLKDEPDGLLDEPPVRIFVMGENQWRAEQEWPLARAVDTRFYLHSQGRANSLSGNGRLDTSAPGDEDPDVFVYDPGGPVLSLGGHSCCFAEIAPMGPADQRPVESRNDVLVYTTAPLDRDLEVTGPVTLLLWAASTAVDTDFTAKLVDVYPDGRAINLCDGIVRARFRDSLTQPAPIEPDRVYAYRIRVGSTSNLFRASHCLRLEVSSSNFPQYDRNLNTGHDVGWDSLSDRVVATQTILHDAAHPSHLVLPAVPR
jgi:putative CocE/NonD family hydrolase